MEKRIFCETKLYTIYKNCHQKIQHIFRGTTFSEVEKYYLCYKIILCGAKTIFKQNDTTYLFEEQIHFQRYTIQGTCTE